MNHIFYGKTDATTSPEALKLIMEKRGMASHEYLNGNGLVDVRIKHPKEYKAADAAIDGFPAQCGLLILKSFSIYDEDALAELIRRVDAIARDLGYGTIMATYHKKHAYHKQLSQYFTEAAEFHNPRSGNDNSIFLRKVPDAA